MNSSLIQKTIGLMLIIFSMTLFIPLIISFLYVDQNIATFIYSIIISFLIGSILFFPNYKTTNLSEIKIKEGFLIVVSFWVSLSLFGTLPFIFDKDLSMGFTNAFFESVSGWTTTGATVITDLDNLSPSILMYRQLLQWFGGMGIVVLALAVLPMLGVGGMQLYKAESSGPIKDNKISPRIAETAQNLWKVYLGLTVLCGVSYYAAGMNIFDAFAHSFSTIAIGGFSTHSDSIAYFNNPVIEVVCIVFMFLSSLNFILHFFSLKNRNLNVYTSDIESKSNFIIIISSCLILITYLYVSSEDNIYYSDLIFQVVSFATTSGFTSTSYDQWPAIIITSLLFLSFIGACAGSTGGGIKVIRVLLILKQLRREIMKIIHPSAEVSLKINQQTITDDVISKVTVFFIFYFVSYFVLSILLLFSGLDATTAFSSVASCLNNLGPGAGLVVDNYNSINMFSKYVLTFTMILGRLEIYTLIIVLTPYFWKY